MDRSPPHKVLPIASSPASIASGNDNLEVGRSRRAPRIINLRIAPPFTWDLLPGTNMSISCGIGPRGLSPSDVADA